MSIFAGRVFMCAVVLVAIVSVPLGLLAMREDRSSELVGVGGVVWLLVEGVA